MKKGRSIYFDVFVLFLMAAVFILALDLEYFDLKLLPLMVSGAGFVLMAVGLVNTLRTRRKAGGAQGDETPGPPAGIYLRYLREGLWLAGFFAAISLVGFPLGILFFITAYLKANRVSWASSLTAGIIGTITLFCVFNYLLEVQLYPGLILKALGI